MSCHHVSAKSSRQFHFLNWHLIYTCGTPCMTKVIWLVTRGRQNIHDKSSLPKGCSSLPREYEYWASQLYDKNKSSEASHAPRVPAGSRGVEANNHLEQFVYFEDMPAPRPRVGWPRVMLRQHIFSADWMENVDAETFKVTISGKLMTF